MRIEQNLKALSRAIYFQGVIAAASNLSSSISNPDTVGSSRALRGLLRLLLLLLLLLHGPTCDSPVICKTVYGKSFSRSLYTVHPTALECHLYLCTAFPAPLPTATEPHSHSVHDFIWELYYTCGYRFTNITTLAASRPITSSY